MTDSQIAELKAELKEIRTRLERLTYAVFVLAFLSGATAIDSIKAFLSN